MKQNQVSAFAEENMKTIYAYALSRVSNREDAEDLAGDILLALLSNASRLRDETALYGFVWSIAGNTYKKFLRKKNRHTLDPLPQDTLEQLASQEDFTEDLVLKEDRLAQITKLRRELSLLSREYRECTLCYYFQGLSCQETAQKLGISLNMTKYYLFKTRKLLKEGIGMEREYGTKSYSPSQFSFSPLFSGSYNPEYRSLFNRLLPGNILLSAYYSPVTVRELALELGVPAAYLEDETALLVRYGLLSILPSKSESGSGNTIDSDKEPSSFNASSTIQQPSGRDRYQTNMIIFTEEYMGELYERLTPLCTERLPEILDGLRRQLAPLREIGFRGAGMEDERLLWPLFWLVIHRGHNLFDGRHIGQYTYHPLYADATGINVGRTYSEADSPYETDGFAGYSRINEDYAASFADFGILPLKNRYLRHPVQTVSDSIYSGSEKYVIFDQAQLSKTEALLEPQIQAMADLYEQMVSLGQTLLQNHAPQSVAGLIPDVVGKLLFFDTVGLLGKCALDSGALRLPDTDEPLAVFMYRTTAGNS